MNPPAPTAGHHFGAWLTCPQQAWYAYHGKREDRAPDPSYLRTLQQEGHEHERAMVQRHYPQAVVIPERRPAPEKMALTLAAMQAGAPTIVQGHLRWVDAVGILDALEHVREDPGSPLGHVYRVGEIKRSLTLKTAHVMQAAWYNELLARVQGVVVDEAAFILGDGERRVLPLSPVRDAFERTRASLLQLREATAEPGPALCVACPSCPWRLLCMPCLAEQAHMSLVPGIGRRRADLLTAAGYRSWRDLPTDAAAVLADVGMTESESRRALAALGNLRTDRPVLRQDIRPDRLQALLPATIEFAAPLRGHADPRPRPVALWYQRDGQVAQIEVLSAADGTTSADLGPLGTTARLGLFGGTDLHVVRGLAGRGAAQQLGFIDLLPVVEMLVHAPLTGLGLDTLDAFASGRQEPLPLHSPLDRIGAISRVLTWLTDAAGLAA